MPWLQRHRRPGARFWLITGLWICLIWSGTGSADDTTGQPAGGNDSTSPVVVDTLHPHDVPATPYVLETVDQIGSGSGRIISFAVDDLDGDSWDEFVAVSQLDGGDGVTSIVWIDYPNGQAQTVAQSNSLDYRHFSTEYEDDLNADGAVDLVVGCHQGSESWATVYGIRGQVIAETPRMTGPDNNDSGEWDGEILPLRAIDLDGDGHRDLLSRVLGVYDLEPRGLLAYSTALQDTLWFFRCGAPIVVPGVHPLTDPATGSLLLLVAAYSVANGSTDGGIPDDQSYLFLLDADGNVVQSRSFGGVCSGLACTLDDLDLDGQIDAVVTLGGTMQRPDTRTGILVLDPLTLRDRYSVDPGCFVGVPRIHDLDGDGHKELVTHAEQDILIYDDRLRLETQIPFDSRVNIHEINDLTGDGRLDIVVSFGLGQTIGIVSPRGEWLAVAERPGDGARWLRSLKWGPRKQILYSVGQHMISGYAVNRASITSVSAGGLHDIGRSRSLLIVGSLLIGLVGGAALSVVLIARRSGNPVTSLLSSSRVKGQSAARQAEYRTALTQLTAFGHGEPGAVLARAATLLQAANPDLVRVPDWREEVLETGKTVQRTIPPAFADMLSNRRVFREFNVEPEKLEAGLQRILAGLDGLEAIFRDGVSPDPEPFMTIGQDVRELDDRLRRLRLGLRASFRCDVPDVVSTTLAMKRQALREAGVTDFGISVKGEGNFVAHIDGHRLQFEILDDLISNAARAMRDVDSRSLAIEVRQEGATIEVRVTDTGCGIEPEIRNSIFDLGVSTKESSGGLGLYQARQAVKDFGGRLFVGETAPGEGTTFIVALPAATFAG